MTNDWIPTAVFIEHFVLEESLRSNSSLEAASYVVLPNFGLTAQGTFLHRETRLLGLLYMLLVFPSEIWKREGLFEVVVERALADDQVSPEVLKLLNVGALRAIRNSVSHARLRFDGDKIIFSDGRNEDAPTFEARLSISDALNMVLVLGRAFHEATQIKSTLTAIGKGTP